MHDRLIPMRRLRRRRPATLLLGTLSAALLLAACGGGGATQAPALSPSPSLPSAPSGDTPVTGTPGGTPSDDLPGQGVKVVVPRPGQLDVHPTAAETLTAVVDDARHIQLTIDWWSGVEPCTILDSIVVERGTPVITVTLREGRGPEDVACIAIAEQHRTVVDLGEFEPGTYTIRDGAGGAPDIEVTVS